MKNEDKNIDRMQRLQKLLDVHFNGRKDELGKFLGYKDGAFVRQMLSGTRPISEKTIDKINSIKRFNNWFGGGDLSVQSESSGTVIAFPNQIKIEAMDESMPNRSNLIIIKQYKDVAGAMGTGLILQDQPGEIISISVSQEWARKNLKYYSSVNNLCIVTGFGDSMTGIFSSGDPLIVDVGVKTLDYDGVYFFRVGDEGFIKTLQRIPGIGIRVISKNKEYEPWTITKDMDFEILAKVLKAWEGTDL